MKTKEELIEKIKELDKSLAFVQECIDSGKKEDSFVCASYFRTKRKLIGDKQTLEWVLG